ncbi:hypothetical protein TREMEDRAFT_59055 [Tremella mesenterica DSM 1558]|uniref:uncharacterized protein n=1 Tax=Tremella mesenterica (strain ATCC 24925 / CBS 8224 / DSM 1558 / NBRC 9311 / NRRL Y-6157 / RJB 2259-6 / UBC 559-6) TaxID=578456 RepID=UPI0003F4A63F|nr:uncharacterized protein TREMEDRAFT_59055 [Tremella mesenterica DSM 1558]EIW72893.1 hypothetical protein TREMEDRAFT_59055 [Tremella mesenterica DSM 1558]
MSDLEAELSQLKAQHSFVIAAKEVLETRLQTESALREAAEENVDALRGQVEQARRGVMQLQKQDKERKRLSQLPPHSTLGHSLSGLGLGGVSSSSTTTASSSTNTELGLEGIDGKKIIGQQHKRKSSQSENSMMITQNLSPEVQVSKVGGLRELRLTQGHSIGYGTQHVQTSPNQNNLTLSPGQIDSPPRSNRLSTPPPLPPLKDLKEIKDFKDMKDVKNTKDLKDIKDSKDFKDLEMEVQILRSETNKLSRRLEESEEARQASESCLKVLREFIASPSPGTDNNINPLDLQGIRLPPLPTDRETELEENFSNVIRLDGDIKSSITPSPVPPTTTTTTTATSTSTTQGQTKGWGFKLWKQSTPTSPALSTSVEPPTTPQPPLLSPGGMTTPLPNIETQTPQLSTPDPLKDDTNTLTPILGGSDEIVTPGDDVIVEGTKGAGSREGIPTGTPLSNLVNWTRGVVPGPPIPPTPAMGNTIPTPPTMTTRKLSSLFSRASKDKGTQGMVKEMSVTKERLEPSPIIGDTISNELEPSPLIGDTSLPISPDLEGKSMNGNDGLTSLSNETEGELGQSDKIISSSERLDREEEKSTKLGTSSITLETTDDKGEEGEINVGEVLADKE